jgi:hypothetical protein
MRTLKKVLSQSLFVATLASIAVVINLYHDRDHLLLWRAALNMLTLFGCGATFVWSVYMANSKDPCVSKFFETAVFPASVGILMLAMMATILVRSVYPSLLDNDASRKDLGCGIALILLMPAMVGMVKCLREFSTGARRSFGDKK